MGRQRKRVGGRGRRIGFDTFVIFVRRELSGGPAGGALLTPPAATEGKRFGVWGIGVWAHSDLGSPFSTSNPGAPGVFLEGATE
jgi:hypothetical protein